MFWAKVRMKRCLAVDLTIDRELLHFGSVVGFVRRSRVLIAVTLAIACARSGDALRPSLAPTSIAAALDSCSGVGTGPPRRWLGSVHEFGKFSLFVPDSARVVQHDSTPDQVSLVWPRCPERCRFGVSVQLDSGVTVEARVARRVAEQKRIDSVNTDPRREGYEFDEMNRPPMPFVARGARGYLIDESCGDCAETSIVFGRGGYIATIRFGGDDDAPRGPMLCQMQVVARTFVWSAARAE